MAFDPLGIDLMGRAQNQRRLWELTHNKTLLPGEMEENPLENPNPMGTAPAMASTDMLPQYLNEQEDLAHARGLKYRTLPFSGNNTAPSLAGLRTAAKRKR